MATLPFAPKRHRGQNFLIDKNILKKIADMAAITKDDIVLEVGPGTGALTTELVKRAKRVIAVEIDRDLFSFLEEKFADCENLTLVKDDILSVDVASLLQQDIGCRTQRIKNGFQTIPYTLYPIPYSIVANLPYNITSRFFRKFLEEESARPKAMIVLVQKEVAQRMIARPPDMNLLALSVQLYADIHIAFSVSRHCFRPKPKVESAVVQLNIIARSARNDSAKAILHLAKAAFSEKRKQCAKTIAKKCGIPLERMHAAFDSAGVPLTARAEEISIEQWTRLSGYFSPSPKGLKPVH